MRDILSDLSDAMSDPDPVRRAQIQMKRPLPKRFYKDVSIGEGEGGLTVLLDGRPVRTPAKRPLAVASAGLAERLRAEWDAQGEEIDPAKMPVTRLVNTALEGVADNADAVRDEIVRFAGTDMICYRADSPERLEEVGRIEREITYLKNVVNDFLDYARRPSPELRLVRLADLLAGTQEVAAAGDEELPDGRGVAGTRPAAAVAIRVAAGGAGPAPIPESWQPARNKVSSNPGSQRMATG